MMTQIAFKVIYHDMYHAPGYMIPEERTCIDVREGESPEAALRRELALSEPRIEIIEAASVEVQNGT